MSKVVTLKIDNFKAIEHLEADFKGCTAIITGGNNKGKTSFLRVIPDRIRFVRPDVMVKQGSTKGNGEMTLDSGERFVWEFATDGTDKLHYFTSDGAKRNVTVELGAKFFPKPFDIDKFLSSSPKEQSKQLQKILGIDFTDIDSRYATAYQIRTDKNRDAENYHAKLSAMLAVPQVDFVDITNLQSKKEAERTRLNEAYKTNKAHNDKLRNEWQLEINSFNLESAQHTTRLTNVANALQSLKDNGYTGKEVQAYYDSITKFNRTAPVEPTYIPELPDDSALKVIDDAIIAASKTNAEAQAYKDYIEYKKSVDAAKAEAVQADENVKAIEAERNKMIQSATFPKGIEITPDGFLVDGLPLDRTQLSSSRITIAALQIAAINLGEVKTLFFDASYLDRNSLKEVNEWAEKNDLQLLIERPDFDGGEITYILIEN